MSTDGLQHIAFGRNDHRDVVTKERTQFILNRQILWVTGSDGEDVVFKRERNNAVELRHGFRNLADHFIIKLGVFQRHCLHAHLLCESLNQLFIGDQLHVLCDSAEQRTGLLLLLFEHNFKLLVSEEAKVNQNLSNATWCHVSVTNQCC